jgi:3-methyladenine DNA glycosylase AlkD
MIRSTEGLRRVVLSALTPSADPERALGAQRYLKTSMPMLGLRADDFRRALKPVFARLELPDAKTWRALVLGLFRGATYRDEWWAAAFLASDRRALEFHTMDALPMYQEMIVTAAWWDVVDDLATHRLGEILKREAAPMKRAMRAWSRDGNLWKRRSAILCQVPLKSETDLRLLYDVIEPSLASKEFFLRKAIGWALRSYAWTDPDEIARFVKTNRARMSGLSIREALKNVGRTAPETRSRPVTRARSAAGPRARRVAR